MSGTTVEVGASSAASEKQIEIVRSHPRDSIRPSYAEFVAPDNRGRREGRALAAPVARLRKKMQAAGTTGLAEHTRPSLRNGFNGCFAFSLVRRLAGHHHERDTPGHRHPLDISVGISGPRDLTVRASPFVRAD
ncbi:hypothetical protein [Bradyrhizobium sp. SZCCHNR1015]|uniref:hypothetical protein n=1 Tax=Bradyrhizobium sp. SZCCHNR1015 TaxID=3057338 RepID=UPI0029161088|nr:hypothetical protein [Bradyrhizobium sp. SZCCHNR1015]